MGALSARSQSGFPVPPDLLRLSVGLEGPGDLYADPYAALRGAPER